MERLREIGVVLFCAPIAIPGEAFRTADVVASTGKGDLPFENQRDSA